MGERKARRDSFFRSHPFCCFCGGEVTATTEDHWPPRMIFEDRQWPEGFVFPACEPCNRTSSSAEALIALLIHGAAQNEDRTTYRKVVASIRQNHPGLVEGLLPNSASDVRRILRTKGLSKPEGITLRELPIIKLDVDRWQPLFDVFAAKAMMAFHYQCFRMPLSKRGRIWYALHTNVDLAAGQFPSDIFDGVAMALAPQRNQKLLNGQFDLIWQNDVEHKTALWSFAFHNKIAFTGITTEAANEVLEGYERTLAVLPWEASPN